MKKLYKAEYNGFETVIAIDHDICTDEMLHEINNFWSSSEWRLSCDDGDIAKTVVRLLAQTCFALQYEKFGLNHWGMMKCFDWDDDEGVEGWPKMDGSSGILLVRCDQPEIEVDFITIDNIDEMPAPPTKPEW